MYKTIISVITATLIQARNTTCGDFAKIYDTHWQNISHGKKFHLVAANTKSSAIWASMKKNHASAEGSQIAHFENEEWKEDLTQPKGAWKSSLAIDPSGNPAFAARQKPHSIYYKKQGNWTEIPGCSYQVAFGVDGAMYRLGCEYYIFKYEGDKWRKLSPRKALKVAAGEDGLWIVDSASSWQPFKYDSGKFLAKVNGRQAYHISTGLKSQVIITDYHTSHLYTLVDSEWKLMNST